MDWDSCVLAILLFCALIVEIIYYYNFRDADTTSLERGGLSVWMVSLPTILIACIVSFFVVYGDSKLLLQYYYYFIFIACMILSVFFVLPIRSLSKRLIPSFLVGVILFFPIIVWHAQWWQNIYMAAAFLWTGPVLVKKFKISTGYLLGSMIIFTVFDIYSIYFNRTVPAFSDDTLRLNATALVGGLELGLGDFFFAYTALCLLLREKNKNIAFMASVFFIFPLLLRCFIPALRDITVPYSMLIMPVVLLGYYVNYKHS